MSLLNVTSFLTGELASVVDSATKTPAINTATANAVRFIFFSFGKRRRSISRAVVHRGFASQMLAVHRVVDPAYHHVVVGRLAESNRLLRIGVVLVLVRVVEVAGDHDPRSLRKRDRLLQVVDRLPREAVIRHLEQ